MEILKGIHYLYANYLAIFSDKWRRKFAYLFNKHTEDIKLRLSKTWHIDETIHWQFFTKVQL
ncbi:MAG: hypothetical protein B5M48_01470 [Candidatus Omnitrophica bacterium 4484_213]|nr:MAG: hypothetical protein B5M48_01470 [Candidatus Omnitrophica bacterium 4484_213]